MSNYKNTLLSICIPTFNRSRYLDSLLHAFSNEIDKWDFSCELLIGDNGSQDETFDVVRKYSGVLNLRYFRRLQNIGPYRNIDQLFLSATGRYLIYLADDDLLIYDQVRQYISFMENNPRIGAVFAPWFIHDKLANVDTAQFFSIEHDVLINQGNQKILFDLLTQRHIFPEIFIVRSELRRRVGLVDCRHAFWAFTQISCMLDRSSIYFGRQPFYRSVSRYFRDEDRSQLGLEEVKNGWDGYCGGLEYILSRFAHQLSPADQAKCRAGIELFTAIRMQVGLRIRTSEGKNWIDNYFIANRLRSFGGNSALPAPYELYRVSAAFEYLLSQNPFAPAIPRFAYYEDDPPRIFNQTREFSTVNFETLKNRQELIPQNTIVLTSAVTADPQPGIIYFSESDLLERFP